MYFKFLRVGLILLNDLIILNLSLFFSYYLRIEYIINVNEVKIVFLISSVIYLAIFFIFNIYKQYFRYFNYNSYGLYLKIYFVFLIIFIFYVFLQSYSFIPRSLGLIFPSFFFVCLIINRVLVAKIFKFKLNKKQAIVFGFNSSNINALSSYVKINCFVDDDKNKITKIFNGIKILSSDEFIKNYSKFNFNLILIEKENIFNKIKYKIRNHIIQKEILVQKITFNNNEIITGSYFDFNYFFNRKHKINPIKNIYNNKTILITGAGGSIGSNIVFQLLKSNYKKLILVDNSEYNLFNLESYIKKKNKISFLLKNFSDTDHIKEIFNKYKIDVVFHAAAYKHVPLIEVNPFSAIKNNFLDTYELMKSSIMYNVSYFCLISSDKAVRPTNIMGSSKRLAELAMRYFSSLKNHKTTFSAVRFGNVINSSGSVKPLFQYQISNNLPLTLTHKKIIRYFMTIEEAANLVLNTYKISKGGEIFLLDMGEPIKLHDLAKLMIQFSGKTIKKNGRGDIEIKIIGLRDGEKLYEELLIDKESTQSSIKSIYQSLETKISNKNFQKIYSEILNSYKSNNINSLKKILKIKFISYQSNE